MTETFGFDSLFNDLVNKEEQRIRKQFYNYLHEAHYTLAGVCTNNNPLGALPEEYVGLEYQLLELAMPLVKAKAEWKVKGQIMEAFNNLLGEKNDQ